MTRTGSKGRGPAGWIPLLLLVLGCEVQPRTQTIVLIDADQEVRDRAAQVVVTVDGLEREEAARRRLEEQVQAGEWPLRLALALADGDGSTTYEVVVRVLDTGGGDLVVGRLISGYVPDHTRFVTMMLEADCIGRPCSANATCAGSLCVNAERDPERFAEDAQAAADSPSLGLSFCDDSVCEDPSRGCCLRLPGLERPDLAVADDGSHVVVGRRVVEGRDDTDVFITRWDADGEPSWTLEYDSGRDEFAAGVAIDPAGDILVTGGLPAPLQIQGTALDAGLLLMRLDPQGRALWAQSYGDAESKGEDIALGPDGALHVSGAMLGAFDAGDVQLEGGGRSSPMACVFEPDGTPRWGLSVLGEGYQYAGDIAVSVDGDTWMTGGVATPQAGDLQVEPTGTLTEDNALLLGIDAEGRPTHLSVHTFSQNWKAITVAPDGTVYVGNGSYCCGARIWAHAPDGREIALHRAWGGAIAGLAVGPEGNLYAAGAFDDALSDHDRFVRLRSGGGADIFVAVFTPELLPLSFHRFGGELDDHAYAIDVAEDGTVRVVGTTEREDGGKDGFLLTFVPPRQTEAMPADGGTE